MKLNVVAMKLKMKRGVEEGVVVKQGEKVEEAFVSESRKGESKKQKGIKKEKEEEEEL